jgi:hypothetical protein
MVAAGMARKVENVKVVHAAADSSDTYLHDTRPTLMSSLDTIVHGDQVGHLIKQISDEPVWLLAVEEGWIKEGAVISVPRLPDIEAEAAQYGEEYEDENQEIREA